MSLYELPAYEEGCAIARHCIGTNHSAASFNNPYPYNTEDWRAWNLGWNTTLRAEQP